MITEHEVRALLETPNKMVARPFSWVVEASGHTPKNYVFESGLLVGDEIPEALSLRVRYRDAKLIERGIAVVTLPESFSCALFLGPHRISALDTNPAQVHTNRVGAGRPYSGQTIRAATHRHVWVGEYGYVEPLEPPLLDVIELLNTFADENNLAFQGNLQHPLKGTQMGLGI